MRKATVVQVLARSARVVALTKDAWKCIEEFHSAGLQYVQTKR